MTTAAQQAVLQIAALLNREELLQHVLVALDGLETHEESEVGCIMVELLCALAAEINALPIESEVLPRLLRFADSSVYLLRKVTESPHLPLQNE